MVINKSTINKSKKTFKVKNKDKNKNKNKKHNSKKVR